MKRYDAIIGKIVIMNKEYPILRCEVITDDMEVAEFLMEMMGHPFEEVDFKKTNSLPKYQEYQLN